jgi:hypothetical protein
VVNWLGRMVAPGLRRASKIWSAYLYSSGAGEKTDRLAGKENTVDFNPPNKGLVTPMSPPKNGLPAEDAAPAGSDWDMEKMTIGPAKTIRPGSPNPTPAVSPSDVGLSLVAELNWTIPPVQTASRHPESQ